MDKIYNFTNENVSSYQALYDFSNAKVLSVLGSGDQYFSSLLYGASSVELFDINPIAWDYFVLKFYGIKILDYEDFYNYFVTKLLNDLEYFNRLSRYLPLDVKKRLSELHKKHNGLSALITPDSGDSLGFNNGRVIPYFDKEKYYQLKEVLKNKKLPTFYLEDFLNLPSKLERSYDIILASNIFYWVYFQNELEHVSEYKDILKRFKYGEIQTLYYSGVCESIEDEFRKNGFDIEYVNPASIFSFSKDTVISLRKR